MKKIWDFLKIIIFIILSPLILILGIFILTFFLILLLFSQKIRLDEIWENLIGKLFVVIFFPIVCIFVFISILFGILATPFLLLLEALYLLLIKPFIRKKNKINEPNKEKYDDDKYTIETCEPEIID